MLAVEGRTVLDKSALATDVDMVLVLGGDGTLMGMADCIADAGSGIPILGVNFGSPDSHRSDAARGAGPSTTHSTGARTSRSA